MDRHRMAISSQSRIAIIGAGVSGLTAAYRLQKNGFRNLAVFEANPRIGGKVRSLQIDGHVLEIGALYSASDTRTLFDMGRDLGLLAVRRVRPRFMVQWTTADGTRRKTPLNRFWGGRSIWELLWGAVRLAGVVVSRRFRSHFRPGFHNLHPDLLHLTMREFGHKYKFDALLEPCYAFTYGCGYGALDSLPALYALKFARLLAKSMLRRQVSLGLHPGAHTFVGGFQRFLEQVAARLVENGLTLRPGSPVIRVARTPTKGGTTQIAVTAGGETSHYDHLLVTCPPRQSLGFLDATDEERELFARVSHIDYDSVVFRATALRENEVVALRENMDPRRHGHLFFYMSDWPGSDLFVGYQVHEADRSHADLDDLLRQDVAAMGGEVAEIVLRTPWHYFPHVKLDHLDPQYYPQLNALQGQQGTYYLGSLVAFETVDHCAEFAKYVVDEFFPPSAAKRP